MNWLEDRIHAVLQGAAVGDALGGAIEGWSPEQIQERHNGPVTGIVGPFYENWKTARPIAPYYKGDGHITDDTLMTHALVEVYAQAQRHLDAYDIATYLVPKMMNEIRWVPEFDAEATLLQRVFLAEKWIVAKLHYGHQDPREAGVGNIVNCGAAMYMAPVGIVNAGNPRAAYLEGLDLAGTHQWSYGREAAGIFAAAVAAALQPEATAQTIFNTCLELAHDGTRAALEAMLDVVEQARKDGVVTDQTELNRRLRDGIRPFDTVGETYREPAMDARRASRTKSIEELPVALGLVLAHQGDFVASVLGATNYGRDADSIATMAGSICAALGGTPVIPQEWIQTVEQASKISIGPVADSLYTVTRTILSDDLERTRAEAHVTAQLLGE
ncbi:ADP-ribosylglycohydrolase family protein [Timonella sp. A28]|uniref:ADP-ribosylglycohydrolase family protein n=1 Tax=Timonella sp. A28 TaxID=3442640 RepID=UPI003EBDC9B8